jgi:hypothetical protein
MRISGRALALNGALALGVLIAQLGSTNVAAQQEAAAQQKKEKYDKAQRQEIDALVKLVDQSVAGQPAPAGIPFTFRYDVMKARSGRTFVPFMLVVEPGKLPSPSLTLYVRLAAKNQPADAASTGQAAPQAKDKAPRTGYPYEGIYFIEAPTPAAGEPYRIQRALEVPGGDYDIYLALRERPKTDKPATPPAAAVVKQSVSLPDFTKPELTTSSVIIAKAVDVLQTPLPAEQAKEEPYTLGQLRIIPALDTRFPKSQEITFLCFVYNAATDANKKPDVTVDYNFYRTVDGAEKFFNKTAEPQVFNAETLPKGFDEALGHQLPADLPVALTRFPEGDYRIEIKITDKARNAVITRSASFKVVAGNQGG